MLALLLALSIALADQATKELVRGRLPYGEVRPVVEGFLNLTHLRNTGAAWGMFGGQNTVLVALSVLILALLVFFRRSFLRDSPAHRVALGLMAGGIVGNLFDRVKLGYVVDFLDVHAGRHHWPAVNVADSAICIGVGIYVVSTLLEERRGRAAAAPAPPAAPGESDRPSA
jgi:signal peptidase II